MLVFVLASAVAFSVLLLFERIHSVAWFVLALGLGVRAAAWARGREASFRRGVRIASLVGAGCVAAGVGWSSIGRDWRERTAIAGLESSGGPSVLLIVLDTVRASNLGLFGYQRPTTPTLDSLARESLLFDYAFSTAPWTLPSHASLFTGLWGSQHGADWISPLSDSPKTLAEAYVENGYATGAFTANLLATGYGTGLHRGFLTYRDHRRTLTEIALHSTLAQSFSVQSALRRIRRGWLGGAVGALARFDFRPDHSYQTHQPKPAPEVTREFLEWERSLGGRPFFAFLNYFDAHAPYRSPMRTLFDEGETAQDRYDGAIRYLDAEIGRLLDSLRSRNRLDECVIVITSDHGELFGEHGLVGHGNSLYLPLLHVPLLIRFPDGAWAGRRVAATVSLRDLPATLAFASGLAGAGGLPGRPLLEVLRDGDGTGRDAIAQLSRAIGKQPPGDRNRDTDLTALVNDTLHLIRRDASGSIEAYRYRADPAEALDISDGIDGDESMTALLIQALRRAGIRRP